MDIEIIIKELEKICDNLSNAKEHYDASTVYVCILVLKDIQAVKKFEQENLPTTPNTKTPG